MPRPLPAKRTVRLWQEHGSKIGTLITEPYLGGGGSYHPPAAYLQLLERFCREHDIAFILDEVQANFGRTGHMFAYETYGIEPDVVVLGKGLGNGVPVAAAVGRADIIDSLNYGGTSDTWSANPLSCAAVDATLEEYESRDVLGPMREVSALIEAGLVKLKEHPIVKHVRGEKGGMVWGIEFDSPDAANAFVLEAYRGAGSDGVHLLGPLSKVVVRVAPPLIISKDEAIQGGEILFAACARIAAKSA
jgi:4-aminobutyrate aminotransferase-like enzyme